MIHGKIIDLSDSNQYLSIRYNHSNKILLNVRKFQIFIFLFLTAFHLLFFILFLLDILRFT